MTFDMRQYRQLALRTKSQATEKSQTQLVRSWELYSDILEEVRDHSSLIDSIKRYGIYGKDDNELQEQLSPIYPVGDKAERIKQCRDLLHGLIGIIGECGEKAEKVLDHIETGTPLDLENMCEELGDSLWFLNLVAAFCGPRDLVDVAAGNIAKLASRYKEKFTLDEYSNRDKASEMAAMNKAVTS